MPANKKYLTVAIHNRIAKISAAILGALFISAYAHLAAAQWLDDYKIVLMTFQFSLFPIWITLMILPFLFHNGWKCWLYYLSTISILYGIFAAGQIYHPIAH